MARRLEYDETVYGPPRLLARRERSNTLAAAFLATGLVIAVTIAAAAYMMHGSHQVIGVAGKVYVYVIDTRDGSARLCGPEACVPIPVRVVGTQTGQ
jgi:hypothetical protein